MNKHDSTVIEGLLTETGLEHTQQLDEADIILVNTCCVRERAETRQKGRVSSLKRYKTANRDVIIGVCGCIAQKDREKLFEELPHIDLVIGPQAIPELPAILNNIWAGKKQVCGDFLDHGKVVTGVRPGVDDIATFITVMKGCDNYCSYCIVPYVRGGPVSRAPGDIMRELESLSLSGIKEVTLLGQNVNAYGLDLAGNVTFVDLLKAIDTSGFVERVRFVTSHPKDFTRELVATVAEGKTLCACFHLPAQAGSDHILKRMHRGYTRDEYLEKTGWIRNLIPDAAITTDLIVGFPGETEDEFLSTVSLVEAVRFEKSHTFYFSPREGTAAADLPGLLPLEERKDRLRRLVKVTDRITGEQAAAQVGKVLEVLVEGPSKKDAEKLMGRTRADAIVIIDNEENLIGKLVKVRIDESRTWTLFGSRVDTTG